MCVVEPPKTAGTLRGGLLGTEEAQLVTHLQAEKLEWPSAFNFRGNGLAEAVQRHESTLNPALAMAFFVAGIQHCAVQLL